MREDTETLFLVGLSHEARKGEVEKDQVWPCSIHALHGLLAGDAVLNAGADPQAKQVLGELAIVIDEEDSTVPR